MHVGLTSIMSDPVFFYFSLGVCRQQGWLESRAHPIGDLSRRALKSIPASGVSASQARRANILPNLPTKSYKVIDV